MWGCPRRRRRRRGGGGRGKGGRGGFHNFSPMSAPAEGAKPGCSPPCPRPGWPRSTRGVRDVPWSQWQLVTSVSAGHALRAAVGAAPGRGWAGSDSLPSVGDGQKTPQRAKRAGPGGRRPPAPRVFGSSGGSRAKGAGPERAHLPPHLPSPSPSPGQPPSVRLAMYPARPVPPGAALELVPSAHAATWDLATLDLPGGGSGHEVPSSRVCGCCWEPRCRGALSTAPG